MYGKIKGEIYKKRGFSTVAKQDDNIVAWYTTSTGKHIPIHDGDSIADHNADIKKKQIAQNKAQADKKNSKVNIYSNKSGYTLTSTLYYTFGDSHHGKSDKNTGEGHYEYRIDKNHSAEDYDKKTKRVSKEFPDFDIKSNIVEGTEGDKYYSLDIKIKKEIRK